MLVRHAKAEAHTATDVERPLADRGRRDATAAGRWLADSGFAPELAVVSPAVRARQTWEQIARAVPDTAVEFDGRIYANTVDDLLAVITELPDDTATVALVGHNPSMHALAAALDDGAGDAAARDALSDDFPTCAIAIFDVATAWPDATTGTGTLRALVVPRG